jgi:hypothetical protein
MVCVLKQLYLKKFNHVSKPTFQDIWEFGQNMVYPEFKIYLLKLMFFFIFLDVWIS